MTKTLHCTQCGAPEHERCDHQCDRTWLDGPLCEFCGEEPGSDPECPTACTSTDDGEP